MPSGAEHLGSVARADWPYWKLHHTVIVPENRGGKFTESTLQLRDDLSFGAKFLLIKVSTKLGSCNALAVYGKYSKWLFGSGVASGLWHWSFPYKTLP